LCLFQLLASGSEQFNSKPKKGIMFLQEHHLLSTPLDPQEVVHFLRENPRLDKKMIGEYISNRSNLQVLDCFVKWVISGFVWNCTLYEEFCVNFSMKCCTFIYDLRSMLMPSCGNCLLTFRDNVDSGKYVHIISWIYIIGCWLSFFPTRTLDPWRWDRYVVPKCRWTITTWRRVISQKSADLINIGAEAWNQGYLWFI
jgi:hypothetical protein